MYRSLKKIQNKDFCSLKRDLATFLKYHDHIRGKSFRNRKIFLSKLPEIILKRRSSAKKRLSCFLVAMDILKNNQLCTKNRKKQEEFSVEGLDALGIVVEIHLREEKNFKNKKLFFISCFPKKTPTH